MKIILDTNILVQDYYLSSPSFLVFLDGLTVIPATLHISEVVVDEVINCFKENLRDKYEVAMRVQNDLEKLLKSDIKAKIPIIEVEQEETKYKQFISRKFKEIGALILPYPDVQHKRVVARDLARQKPFKSNGSGYRDFLIWESIRKLMLLGTELVCFITNNPRDFGEGPHVDPDLQKDISNPQRLVLYRSLQDFNDALVLPKLSSLEDIRTRLQEEHLDDFDIRIWLNSNLLDLLRERNCYWECIIAGFPFNVGFVRLSEIEKYENISVDIVKALAHGKTLISFHVEINAAFAVEAGWNDYIANPDVRNYFGSGEEPFSSISTNTLEKITVYIDLIINSDSGEVESKDVAQIFGPNGRFKNHK